MSLCFLFDPSNDKKTAFAGAIYEKATEASQAQVLEARCAYAGHDLIMVSWLEEDKSAPHELLQVKRRRDQTGTAEEQSAEITSEICRRHGIAEESLGRICTAVNSTTVDFIDDEVRHTRLTKGGDPIVNFLTSKADTGHLLVLKDRLRKQSIVLRYFLEDYPLLTAELLTGDLKLPIESYEWLKEKLGIYLARTQVGFANSQRAHLLTDASLCGIAPSNIDRLAAAASLVKLRIHNGHMHDLLGRVNGSPISMLRALNQAVDPIKDTRKRNILS